MAQRVNIEVLNKAAVDVTVQNSNAINVEVPTAPRGLSAEFTANQTEIDQGQSVNFSATNAGFEYYWGIQDTTGFNFKNGKNVSHQYAKPGEFDVALTQADLNQQASGIQIKRDFIKVNEVEFLLNKPFATGATAAYSLRKLKSTATKAVRVREDSGNSEIDIGFSGALLDETALLNHCGSANGFVTKWYDQSGNANDASNFTASEQPQIVSGGSVLQKNNKPIMEADNKNVKLEVPTTDFTISATPVTFFILAEFGGTINGNKNKYVIDSLNGNKWVNPVLKVQSDFAIYAKGGYSVSKIKPINKLFNLYTTKIEQGDAKIYIDTVQEFSGTANFNFLMEGLTLFNYHQSGYSDGNKLSEVIIYDSDKSADRANIETNINNYYSIF